jgi:toxin ParE1/3/4
MPRLRYSAKSKEDLKSIARYIANDNPTAARRWAAKLKAKCRLASQRPNIGEDRADLADDVRATYVGRYIIFFREREGWLEIIRIVPGDLEFPFL